MIMAKKNFFLTPVCADMHCQFRTGIRTSRNVTHDL